jgi:hypothetical protein
MARGRLPGTKLGEAHKEALSISLKGNIPWNKGIKTATPKKLLTAEERANATKLAVTKAAITRKQNTIKKYISSVPDEWMDVTLSENILTATHKPCGNIITVQPQTIRKWSWGTGLCRKCIPTFRGVSKAEIEIADFCSSICPVSRNVKYKGFEIDIEIPSKNIAIEYNGLYWHSSANGYTSDRHLSKTQFMEQRGWQLIHIFEDEWVHKQKIVKDRIRHLLGFSSISLGARKTKVVSVSPSESTRFLNNNHLQGAVGANIRLGLEYDNKLVALMTFGKPRYQKHHSWELIRYCTLLGHSVVGGAGKLLAAFMLDNPGSILSYADRRWSRGQLYKQIGFTQIGISPPGYFYFKGDLRVNRQTFQKSKLKLSSSYSENKTEQQIMYDDGWHKIWDCGNLIFSIGSNYG